MAKNRPYDFCGWATANDILCSDGRIIRKNAFIDNDGEEVPLVYQHVHSDPENILGHALLENRDKGVYCYCWFNKNPKAQAVKNAMGNGDINALSIYANQLVQRGSDVIHGMIREVSVVLTGANKGARIENLNFAHSDGSYDVDDEEAIIYSNPQSIHLSHSDDMEEEDMDQELNVQEVLDGMTEEQLAVVNALYEQGQIDALDSLDDDEEEYEDDEDLDEEDYDDDEEDPDDEDLDDEDYDEDDEDDFEDEEEYDDDDDVEHSDVGGYGYMKTNVFDGSMEDIADNTLSHAETEAIFADAKRVGSLKESVLAHTADYGIDH